MRDYPEHNMFVQEGTGRLLVFHHNCPTGLLVILSPFNDRKTEEQNVVAVRETRRHVPGDQTSPCLAYGEAEGQSFGIVIFRPSGDHAFRQTKDYCLEIARTCSQPGIITWDSDDAAYLETTDGIKTELPPWNRTVERLNEWCQHLKPGFQVQGIWNREMTYVHMRHAQLDGRLPRRDD
jgi:hypothetical protein